MHRRTVRLVWLVVGLALLAVYPVLSTGLQCVEISLAAGAAGAAACWKGSRRTEDSTAWWLLGIGLLQAACGEALWGLYEVVWHIDPFPSVADIFYLAFYPFVAVALIMLLRRRTGRDSGAVLDATVAALGIGVLIWQFVVVPQVADTDMGLLALVVSCAYPAGDVLLLGLLLRLAFARQALGLTGVLMTAGIGAMFLADISFMLLEINGAYGDGHLIDLGWLLSYGLLGVAALTEPSPPDAHTAGEVLPTGRLVLLMATSLTAPGVLIWQGATRAKADTLTVGVVSALLFVLVLLRMRGLVRRVEKQAWELQQLSVTDPLTGLPNRRSWDLVAPRAFGLAARTGEPLCVAMLDLDHFKRFNDEHGHTAGDALLRDAATAWRNVIRDSDVLVRYGGEEFALLLPGCDTPEAEEVVSRVRATIPGGQTCSAGIARRLPGEDAPGALHRADQALYAAKSLGRDRTVVDRSATTPGPVPLENQLT